MFVCVCMTEDYTYLFILIFFSDEMEKIKIPKDMDDAKALGTVLYKYKDTYYTQVLVAYFATYVLYPWRKHAPFGGKRKIFLLTVFSVTMAYSGYISFLLLP